MYIWCVAERYKAAYPIYTLVESHYCIYCIEINFIYLQIAHNTSIISAYDTLLKSICLLPSPTKLDGGHVHVFTSICLFVCKQDSGSGT